MLAVKAVQQNYTPNSQLLGLLEQFRQMVNNCIRVGLAENVTSLKSLSLKTYRQLEQYDSMSYYKLCAISKAAGILKNYRKAKRRGKPLKQPYAHRFKRNDNYVVTPTVMRGGSSMLPDPPPTLRGKEAVAFLEDLAKPLTKEQLAIIEKAKKEFLK